MQQQKLCSPMGACTGGPSDAGLGRFRHLGIDWAASGHSGYFLVQHWERLFPCPARIGFKTMFLFKKKCVSASNSTIIDTFGKHHLPSGFSSRCSTAFHSVELLLTSILVESTRIFLLWPLFASSSESLNNCRWQWWNFYKWP